MQTTDEVADYAEEDYGEEGMGMGEDAEIEEMKRRMAEMEQEHNKLAQMSQTVEKQLGSASDSIDENSVYVGQVDYEATPEELKAHFSACGAIARITILCDKFTGHSKGFAYVEFGDQSALENALKLDGSLFKGRQIKVLPKRHNEPSFKAGRGGRGPPFRGGGRGFAPRGGGRGRFPSYGRGRGGGFRGGGFAGRGRGYHEGYY